MSDALVTQLARSLNLPPDAARHTLNHLVATLRDQLDATGQARVPGLGTFRHDEGGLSFLPDDALARAVNHRYAGLRPIEAGPSSAGREPEEREPEEEPEPTPEANDPFAEAVSFEDTSEEDVSEEGGRAEEASEPIDAERPEPAVGFQPLESFIEPDASEPDEPEDEFAPKPTDASEQAQSDEPPFDAAPSEEVDEFGAEEPVAEDLVEEEPSVDEEHDLDELLAGTWTEHANMPDDEHVLGPLPPDDIEDADYALVESEEDLPDEESFQDVASAVDIEPSAGLPEEQEEAEASAAAEMGWEDVDWEETPQDDEISYDEEMEPAETTVPPAPAEPPAIAAELSQEPEAEPPTKSQPVAPAVAATARPPAGREPAEPVRRRSAPIVLTVLGVVLGVVALLWFLNRAPDGPDIAEQPIPADTAVVAETPPPATDTLAASAPTDTAATVAEAPPEPGEPAASADPLRSTAGIDPAAGGFTWVVASELNRAAAERRVARYREQGLRADVVAEEAGGRTRYRVSLGQFGSIAEAEARRADLPADVPPDSWILQL